MVGRVGTNDLLCCRHHQRPRKEVHLGSWLEDVKNVHHTHVLVRSLLQLLPSFLWTNSNAVRTITHVLRRVKLDVIPLRECGENAREFYPVETRIWCRCGGACSRQG